MKFDYVVGTGGVGKGILYKLDGEHTLGRNESRPAHLTDWRDYCKLHIVTHYIATFTKDRIPVYAVSAVGNDEAGQELVDRMQKAGINTDYITIDNKRATLFAVCFQYPNGDGGNITPENTAASSVSAINIENFFDVCQHGKQGIVLSLPEVPVDARLHMLRKGREHGCFNAASLLTGDASLFQSEKVFELIDLLAVNAEEASAISSLNGANDPDSCYEFLRKKNPDIRLLVTLGAKGVYYYHAGNRQLCPSVKSTVASTAGAGDCFLGTLIAAMIHRIPFEKTQSMDGVITSAVELAQIASSMKVGCADTIDFSINWQSLLDFAASKNLMISDTIRSIISL